MTRIATWNSARDVWETEAVSLLSGRSDVYSETFPISGSMRNGVAYEHQTSAPLTAGSASLFSQLGGELLPSPVAQPSGNTPDDHLRKKPGREVVTDLAIIVENGLLETGGKLLKTPTAQLAVNGGSQHPDKRKAGGHGPTLADEVEHLLPTPQAHDHVQGKTVEQVQAMRERTGAGVKNLNEVAVNELLPTPKAGDADFGMPRTSGRPPEKSTHLMTRMEYTKPESSWGPYAAAIERWEAVLGRPAPDPTELGPKGGRRLSAAFVEWMMGLPEGWVTDPVLGLSRTQQLKMLGNGVVTQQAVAALETMKETKR